MTTTRSTTICTFVSDVLDQDTQDAILRNGGETITHDATRCFTVLCYVNVHLNQPGATYELSDGSIIDLKYNWIKRQAEASLST
jgi:hypothetical protein